MYLVSIFLPLFSFIVIGTFGYRLGPQGSAQLSVRCIALCFICSLFSFYEVGFCGSPVYINLASWFEADLLRVNWAFCFDSLTVVMLVVVSFISTLVHLYSTEYMKEDPHLPRFMSYLSLFTFFMLVLITADNFVQMFVGWEGVGLCSYLLINFWFTRIQANKAAIKAMLVNRIGDFGLVIGLFCILTTFGCLDYATVFALAPQLSSYTTIFLNCEIKALDLIGYCLFIGAVGKSAQLGLHTWLPDAMEGPTPVSALIHAATMVTAGVFLMARCSPLLEYSPNVLSLICCVGGMTAFFSATTALVQNDLKKVIAYSTCSQLGYMIFSCGLSHYSVAVFHLFNHAFFKALLFLGAGSIIHAVGDEQDMRKMGGLRRLLPFTYAVMVIGSLALMGVPFLTGFYSKDVILELAFATHSTPSYFAFFFGCLAACCTAFYSFRLIILCFLCEPNGNRVTLMSAAEGGRATKAVLGCLAILSIFVGYFCKDLFIGLGTGFWGNSIFCLPDNHYQVDSEFIPFAIKILPFALTLLGVVFSLNFYFRNEKNLFLLKTSDLGLKIYSFLNRKWFFDKIYNELLVQNVLNFSYHFSYKTVDRGIVESLGPYGLSVFVRAQSRWTRSWQTGNIYNYSIVLVLSSMFLATLASVGFNLGKLAGLCLVVTVIKNALVK